MPKKTNLKIEKKLKITKPISVNVRENTRKRVDLNAKIRLGVGVN